MRETTSLRVAGAHDKQARGIAAAPLLARRLIKAKRGKKGSDSDDGMGRWLRRLLGMRRRRPVGKSYETLSDPYPPLLAELDALPDRPVLLCRRETHAIEFCIDTVERTFVRHGFDVCARTFGVADATNGDRVVLEGRTHAGRSWVVTIVRADPRDSDAAYYARVRLGDRRYDDLVVRLAGSRLVPDEPPLAAT